MNTAPLKIAYVVAALGTLGCMTAQKMLGPSATATPRGYIEGVVEYEISDFSHSQSDLDYAILPPPGGPHNPAWQNCGIYVEPVLTENAVHSLEHGAVWVTYQPDLAEAEIELLRQLARNRTHVLLSPYTEQAEPVVATAWGVQLRVESAEDARLAQFVQKYENGPQTPEPGAPCSNGVGTPDEK
jgi:hypothetical protein